MHKQQQAEHEAHKHRPQRVVTQTHRRPDRRRRPSGRRCPGRWGRPPAAWTAPGMGQCSARRWTPCSGCRSLRAWQDSKFRDFFHPRVFSGACRCSSGGCEGRNPSPLRCLGSRAAAARTAQRRGSLWHFVQMSSAAVSSKAEGAQRSPTAAVRRRIPCERPVAMHTEGRHAAPSRS